MQEQILQKVNKIKQQVTALKSENKGYSAKVNELQSVVDTLTKERTEFLAEIEALKNKVTNLEKNKGEVTNSGKEEELREKINVLVGDIDRCLAKL